MNQWSKQVLRNIKLLNCSIFATNSITVLKYNKASSEMSWIGYIINLYT